MSSSFSARTIPTPMMLGLTLALTGVLFGFLIGGAFGLIEPTLKGRLAASADAVMTTTYNGDVAARDKVVEKSWIFLQRAHLHAGAIGSVALGAIAILLLVTGRGGIAQLSALALGAGSLVYPIFWLVAGFSAPGLGSTDAAKDAFEWLAVPGAGLTLLGALGTLTAVWTDRRTA